MKRYKDVQTRGLVRMLRQTNTVNKPSWLRWQRLRVLWSRLKRAAVLALMLPLLSWSAVADRRQADAVFVTTVSECVTIQTVVALYQNETVPSPYFPDGWVRFANVSVLERNTCSDTQLLNAAGQLSVADAASLAIDRKLGSAVFTGTVGTWDGISQAEGTVSVSVTWDGTGPPNHQAPRTLSRDAISTVDLNGFGLAVHATTTDAQLSIAK